ncbi:MAG TPA: 7TM diverse intracellular signaling domain-containing protein [Chitinophagaceae bacterium]
MILNKKAINTFYEDFFADFRADQIDHRMPFNSINPAHRFLSNIPESGITGSWKNQFRLITFGEQPTMTPLRRFYYSILIVGLLMKAACLHGQANTTDTVLDVSKIQFATQISRMSSSVFLAPNDSLAARLPGLQFKKGMVYTGSIPAKDVTNKAVIRFRLSNSADTAIKIWFFPGFFYFDIRLFQQTEAGIHRMQSIVPNVKDNYGYRQIIVQPKDTSVYYAEIYPVRTYINGMRPRLIHANRIDPFIKGIQETHRDFNMVTYVISGLLLMLIMYALVIFIQGGNNEFLNYAGYAFFVGGMLFTKAFYDLRPNYTGYFFEGYLDYIMMGLGIICYMAFMRGFLNTRTKHPFLYKLYNSGIALLVLSLVLFSFFHFFTDNYAAEYWVEFITKFVLLLMTIIFLVYSLRRWNDKLLRYVFWGNLCLFVFSLLSQLLATLDSVIVLPGIWDSSLLHYELGLFLELFFFFMGLNYKNNQRIMVEARERERLKTENQMKEYEKELAVYKAQQEERQRISADMHDELGAGMTAIRLMSEIARNKMKESTPVEIERISHSADEVLNKMNAIIWSMNSGNDTLDNLVSYIRSYALEYFESTQVACRVNTPPNIEPLEITGDKRRNIFLCVKETLNNALKHANASLITIDFTINHELQIKITDNGVGIDMQKLRQFGNGLKNISRRMESIGGSYHIENNHGTVTTLVLPL